MMAVRRLERLWNVMKLHAFRIIVIAAIIIIGGAIGLYIYPLTYDICIAMRVPLTTNIVATNSAIGACRSKFSINADCKQRLLESNEMALVDGSAERFSDGDMFIKLYNGNTNIEVKSGKFTLTEAASGTTRTYAFDENIKPLSTETVQVRVFPDNSKPPNWTWQLVEVSACVK
jgi:hypothetical protein